MVRVTFPAVTVIVPGLVLVFVFAAAVILNEPPPKPLVLLTVSQFTLLLTVHVELECTNTISLVIAVARGLHEVIGERFDSKRRFAVAPSCVIVITCGVTPEMETVIVPVLVKVLVFSVVRILNEPLPVRFEGLKLSAISQLMSLLSTVHCTLEVTCANVELAPLLAEPLLGVTEINGLDRLWVTSI